jgi:ATP-dependent helicase/nuclease subunit A
VIAYDSSRIAQAIASEVGRGRRSAGDFLILFRQRKYMAEYARRLEELGVPCEIAGGGAFGDSEELDALLTLLGAVADPDDPVLLVASLRGPLFGVDDDALYRFARSGGRFHYRSDPPAGADPRIRRAFEKLREGEELARTLPPGAAISRFSGGLGWTALAAAEELGASRAGNLLKAFAAARKLSAEGRSFAGVVQELRRMRQETLIEQMSVEPGRGDVVRLMTVHGAKGLEAPVVFLAEPATPFPGGRDHVIDRSVEPAAGHFRVVRRSDRPGDFGEEEIARPLDWDHKEAAEERFEEAEKIRMLYVAATRAKEMLAVSVKKPATGRPGGTWSLLDPILRADLPETAAPTRSVSASLEDPTAALALFSERAADRRVKAAMPGYATAAVTSLAHAQAGPAPAREDTGRGMEWGRIIHRLLEQAMRDPDVDVRAYARNLLAEAERPPSEVDDAVRLIEGARGSALWKRAARAGRRLVEVPFALRVSSSELSVDAGPTETVLSGAIDLAFEEDESWILVDYKSDHVAGNFRELADWYSPQIRHYRRYWEKLTGKPTRAGLYFVETGQEFWLAEG